MITTTIPQGSLSIPHTIHSLAIEYTEDTPPEPGEIVTGNPIGLLLALTYTI